MRFCSECRKDRPSPEFFCKRGRPTKSCASCRKKRVEFVKRWRINQQKLAGDKKRCNSCQKLLPLLDFTIYAQNRSNRCKLCAARIKTHYRQNRESLGKLPRHIPTSRERAESYWRQTQKIAWKLLRIDLQTFEKLVASRENLCAICKQPPKIGKRLVVDHNHTTGKFRSLLCEQCNCGIGYLQDNPQICLAASQYLQTFSNSTITFGHQ